MRSEDLRDTDVFKEPRTFSKFEALFDLMSMKNDGSIETSLHDLASRWQWTKPRVSRFLALLAEEGRFQVQASPRSSTVISFDCCSDKRSSKRSSKRSTNPAQLSLVTTDAVTANVTANVTEKPNGVWPGCKHFRMSEHDLELTRAWYQANNYPLDLINYAIQAVDVWFDKGTPGALKALPRVSHMAQLKAVWVIKEAKDRKADAENKPHVIEHHHVHENRTAQETLLDRVRAKYGVQQ